MQEGTFKKYFKNNYDWVFTRFQFHVIVNYQRKRRLQDGKVHRDGKEGS